MKKIVLACCVLAAFSCKKELNVNEVSEAASQTENVSNAITLNKLTKFGCLINGNFTVDKDVHIAQNLKVKYTRSSLIMDQWKGKYTPFDTYAAGGINVILNINSTRYDRSNAPFPKDMKNYRSSVTNITDKYQPEVAVIENEEINKTYHSGPMSDYIKMLRVALDVCHAKGIKVTNGGIYGASLEISTYRYLQTISQSRADDFGNNCMETFQINAAKKPNSNTNLEADVRKLDTLLNFYGNLDYINVHLYEPFNPNATPSSVTGHTPRIVEDIQEFLSYRTGRPTMTNETGQRDNTSPDLVRSMLKEYDRLKFPYVVWFSGDGDGGAEPLYDMNTGTLQSNGVAFSDFLNTYNN